MFRLRVSLAIANGGYIKARCIKRCSATVYNEYTKLCILLLNQKGLHPPAIERYLREEEGIYVSVRGMAKFIKRVYERGKQI